MAVTCVIAARCSFQSTGCLVNTLACTTQAEHMVLPCCNIVLLALELGVHGCSVTAWMRAWISIMHHVLDASTACGGDMIVSVTVF